MQESWSDRLFDLQREGVLTGFALLSGQGCRPATGPFAEEEGGAASPEAHRLAAPFYSPGPPPTSYDFAGSKLIVVQQGPGSFTAVSRRRQAGVAARHLPCGVLLASFAWPVPAQRVAAELDRCCAALQA